MDKDIPTSSIHITIKNDERIPTDDVINQFSYSMYVDKRKPVNSEEKVSPSNHADAPAKEVAQQNIMEWVDDSKATNCYSCDTEFTMFTRRHHCRYCGKIFCHNCYRP